MMGVIGMEVERWPPPADRLSRKGKCRWLEAIGHDPSMILDNMQVQGQEWWEPKLLVLESIQTDDEGNPLLSERDVLTKVVAVGWIDHTMDPV